MKLKLSNVLCNLDEFKIRYNGLRKSFNTKDHQELVTILNKSGNQLINRKLITLIFEEFFMDFVSPGDYRTEIKYIFDYTDEELNNFETIFDSQPFFPNSKEAKKQVCDSLYKSNLELSKKQKPINLIEQYAAQENDIREKFESFKYKITGFKTENIEYYLSIGDIILFKNGYDVEMITEILGFDSEGDCYLLWDCYWLPIRLNERFIEVISKNVEIKEITQQITQQKIQETTDLINSTLNKKLNHLKEDYLLNLEHISNSNKYSNTCVGFSRYLAGVYKLSLGLTLQIGKLIYGNDQTYIMENHRIKDKYTIEQLIIVIDKILERKLNILKNE